LHTKKGETYGAVSLKTENCLEVKLNILCVIHKDHFGRTIYEQEIYYPTDTEARYCDI
jgi:hypothetical protein